MGNARQDSERERNARQRDGAGVGAAPSGDSHGGDDIGGSKIPAPKGDDRGDRKPGFGAEGERSELADPPAEIDEAERRRIAEHNRRVEEEKASGES